jgi:hypothetical protein
MVKGRSLKKFVGAEFCPVVQGGNAAGPQGGADKKYRNQEKEKTV